MSSTPLVVQPIPSIDVLYGEAQRQLANQIDRSKHIEGKANILTAFAGLAATSLGGMAAHPALLALGCLAAAATFVFGFQALRPAEYEFSTSLGWLRENRLLSDANRTKLTLVDTATEMLEKNHAILDRKAKALDRELSAFLFTIVVIVAGKVIGG